MESILKKLHAEWVSEKLKPNPLLMLSAAEYQELYLFVSMNPYFFSFIDIGDDGCFRFYGTKVVEENPSIVRFPKDKRRLNLVSA